MSTFIVGFPRSGTTLLSSMLNASGHIYFGRETHVFEVFTNWKKSSHNSFIDYYFDSRYNPNIKNMHNSIFNLHTSYQVNQKKFIHDLCAFESKEKGVIRWGEKTPNHYKYISVIRNIFPDAKFINILRDPRDVFLSHNRIEWGIKNPLEFGFKWKKYIELTYEKDYILNVNYEDLLKNPKLTINKICAFIDIPFRMNMISNFYEQNNSNFDINEEPWKMNNLKALDSLNIEKWKIEIDNSRDIQFLSNYLEKELGIYNYEFSNLKSTTNYILLKIKYLYIWFSKFIKNKYFE